MEEECLSFTRTPGTNQKRYKVDYRGDLIVADFIWYNENSAPHQVIVLVKCPNGHQRETFEIWNPDDCFETEKEALEKFARKQMEKAMECIKAAELARVQLRVK
jgi:hypothetical protein